MKATEKGDDSDITADLMSDAMMETNEVKENAVEAASPIGKAEEDMFKDVVNADQEGW